MYLHESPQAMRRLVADAAKEFGRAQPYVYKDYFATLFLREMVVEDPDIVFKGGTCLSKCYNAIARFSEDIDLGIEAIHATEGRRKAMKRAVLICLSKIGLEPSNLEETRSRREFNRYEVPIPPLDPAEPKDAFLVETAVMNPASPAEKMPLQSFIGEYCEAMGYREAVDAYGLERFEVLANSMERTFTDKVYAICDYYLAGIIPARQSRHIYDLYKLLSLVKLDDSLANLFETVRLQRKGGHRCPSAEDGVDVSAILLDIVGKDVYRKDYEDKTVPLLYEEIAYNEASSALPKIAAFLKK